MAKKVQSFTAMNNLVNLQNCLQGLSGESGFRILWPLDIWYLWIGKY